MNKKEKEFIIAVNQFFLIWDQNAPVTNTEMQIIRNAFIKWTNWMKKRDA